MNDLIHRWAVRVRSLLRPAERALDGDASRLVRPYVAAAEQAERRAALAPALESVDAPGSLWIHGVQVGIA